MGEQVKKFPGSSRGIQGIPYALVPEMELFHIPFERLYSEVTNESKKHYSK